jgi:hypothetical protein
MVLGMNRIANIRIPGRFLSVSQSLTLLAWQSHAGQVIEARLKAQSTRISERFVFRCRYLVYLDLLRHLMQCETFKPSQSYELVYPVHDGAFVAFVTPNAVWNHLGNNRAAKS